MISHLARAAAVSLPLLAATAAAASPLEWRSFEDLLFAPTYDPRFVPDAWGTRYDCRAWRRSGKPYWRGLVGGRKFNYEQAYQISREACFATEAECRGYLTVMEGYIDIFFTRECRFGG